MGKAVSAETKPRSVTEPNVRLQIAKNDTTVSRAYFYLQTNFCANEIGVNVVRKEKKKLKKLQKNILRVQSEQMS